MSDILKVTDKDLAKKVEQIESEVTKSKELLSKYIVSKLLDANLMISEEEMKQIKPGKAKEEIDALINSFKNDNTYLYKIYTYLNNLEAQSVQSKENKKEEEQTEIPKMREQYSFYYPRMEQYTFYESRQDLDKIFNKNLVSTR